MTSNVIRKIVEVAQRAPSADNTQPWQLEWDGAKLSIAFDHIRTAGKTFPADSPATLLAIGALIENVMVAAEAWGLQPRLVLADEPGSGSAGLYANISFDHLPDDGMLDENKPIIDRHCNRSRFAAQPIPSPLASQLTQATSGYARTWLSQDKAVRQQLGEIVKQAAEIRFQTREVHEWLAKSLRFSASSVAEGDGLDVATLGLPPGGGLLMRLISDWKRMCRLNTFGFYKLAATLDSAPIAAGPGLMAVIAPTDAASTISAGRLLARNWTHLNASGLAVHPYYVVSDQIARLGENKVPPELEPLAREVAQATTEIFALSGEETLYMILRVGYPKKDPIRSLRLPLEEIFRDSSTDSPP